MGSNTLTPTLDSSMDILEMNSNELSELYTKIHVVWNGLLSGKYYDDWTFEKCRKLNKNILQKMKEENITLELVNDGLDLSSTNIKIEQNDGEIKPKLEDAMNKIKSMLNEDKFRKEEKNKALIQSLLKSQQIIKDSTKEQIEKIKETIEENKPQEMSEDKIASIVSKVLEGKEKKNQEEINKLEKERVVQEAENKVNDKEENNYNYEIKTEEKKNIIEEEFDKPTNSILSEFYKTHQQLVDKIYSKQSHANEIPNDVKKDIKKFPDEIKSIIKDLVEFAKEQGCPQCGEKNIRMVGVLEGGALLKFGCVDCQIMWQIRKSAEDEKLATYNYEKLAEEDILIKGEKKFFESIKKVFQKMEKEYISQFEKGKRKFAEDYIGQNELALTLQAEMEDIAFEGEKSVKKDLKKTLPTSINPESVKFINGYVLELAGNVSKDIAESVRNQIAEGIASGDGIKEIKKRINTVFTEGMEISVPAKIVNGKIVRKAYTKTISAEYRARMIAQTETIRAHNRGRWQSIQNIDSIIGWKYLSIIDNRTSDICLDLNGQEFNKGDDANLPPSHVNCRSTFSYIFAKKKKQEKLKTVIKKKENVKPKFIMQNLKIDIPCIGIKNLAVKTKMEDVFDDKGWIEKGVQLSNFKEFFLHGKKYKGRWFMIDNELVKAKYELPYVLKKQFVPAKGISCLPKSITHKIPTDLKWWEKDLQGETAKDCIKAIYAILNPVPKSLKEEMVDMIEKIEPMKIENQIRNFLGEYKIHKHSISGIDGLKTRKLGTWLGVKNKFKLPLQVEGTGLTSGAWRGMTGEWVYYSDELIKKTAPLLAGAQIRVDHSDDGDALSTVVGWVTESKAIKTKKGKIAIHYKGLIFDPEMAKAVWQKKIRKTSVSPLVQEEIDEVKGLIAKDIKAFDEISILTGNNPACKDATIIAS